MQLRLAERPCLLIDIQTNGIQPGEAEIIEAAWAFTRAAEDPSQIIWQSQLIKPRPGRSIPRSIQKLTGIDEASLEEATLTAAELAQIWREALSRPELLVLVHYARFKLAFIEHLLEGPQLALRSRTICTYQWGKALHPQLKSHSLRALAGHAGYSMDRHKRALDHAQAIAHLWHAWSDQGVLDGDDLAPSRELKPLTPTPDLRDAAAFRRQRLALSEEAGLYFFKDSQGRVLYVGKALRLKQRVNSYFRGRKSKGSHLNEMLVRVHALEVQICQSELEALLLESDAIKHYRPTYNRLLRGEDRQLKWMPLGPTLRGPLPSFWSWKFATSLLHTPWSVEASGIAPLLLDPTKADTLLSAAFSQLSILYGLSCQEPSPEAWLQLALRIWPQEKAALLARQSESNPELVDEEELEEELPRDPDAHKIKDAAEFASFLDKSLRHFCLQLHRSRWLERLLEAKIHWQTKDSVQLLLISDGQVSINQPESMTQPLFTRSRAERRASLDVTRYDRMSIIYRELKRGLRRGDRIDLSLRSNWRLSEIELRDIML